MESQDEIVQETNETGGGHNLRWNNQDASGENIT